MTQKKSAQPRAASTQSANKKVNVANADVVDEPLPKPIEKPQSFFDRAMFYIQLRDSIWSIPLWFWFAYNLGILLIWQFGAGAGNYDLSFIQALAITGCVMVGIGGIVEYVIYFNWRTVQRYFKGKRKPSEGIIKNLSKEDFENLESWQRLLFALFVVFFYFTVAVVVFLKLI